MIRTTVPHALEVETLVDLLHKRAQEQPHKTAYTFLNYGEAATHTSLTYQELELKARLISKQLRSQGNVGKRILLLYPAGLDYIAAYFGCLYAGAIAIPAYPPHSPRSLTRIQAIVADSKADIILTTTSVLNKVKQWISSIVDLSSLIWIATDTLDTQEDTSWDSPNINGQTLAFLQYTSGSTSTPKGVMVSHSNLLHNLHSLASRWEAHEQEVGVSWLPIFHDMGLIAGVLVPLYVGASLCFMAPTDFLQRPLRWLQAISHFKGNWSCAPNFAYELCLRRVAEQYLQELDLSSWRVAINGAEPVRSDTLHRFSRFFSSCGFRPETFMPGYGLAENTLMVTTGDLKSVPYIKNVNRSALEENRVVSNSLAMGDIQQLVGCGQPQDDQQIVIVNTQTLQRCQPEEIGEIWVNSPSVAQGYWQRPEETQQTFHAHLATGEGPFLRTGDLGAYQNNNLFVTGRLKDMIIIGGRNYYPQDIELTAEESHKAIRPGCCVAFSVEQHQEEQLVIIAEIDPRYKAYQQDGAEGSLQIPDKKQLEQEIIKSMRQAISDYHDLQVSKVVLLKMGGVLKTSSGKVQRRACRAAFLDNTLQLWNS